MGTARTYYRVNTTRAHEMTGAGLGYEEMFGDGPRYFWGRRSAQTRCSDLNRDGTDDLRDTYFVEERYVYGDGIWQDEDDAYAREQLRLAKVS